MMISTDNFVRRSLINAKLKKELETGYDKQPNIISPNQDKYNRNNSEDNPK